MSTLQSAFDCSEFRLMLLCSSCHEAKAENKVVSVGGKGTVKPLVGPTYHSHTCSHVELKEPMEGIPAETRVESLLGCFFFYRVGNWFCPSTFTKKTLPIILQFSGERMVTRDSTKAFFISWPSLFTLSVITTSICLTYGTHRLQPSCSCVFWVDAKGKCWTEIRFKHGLYIKTISKYKTGWVTGTRRNQWSTVNIKT